MKMDMSKSINDKAFTTKVEAKNYDRIGRLFNDEDCVSLSLTVHIPYKSRKTQVVYDTSFDADIIGTWAQHLIVALEERQYECQTDLLSNIKNIESNDGSVIEYNVGNRTRKFNCVTFDKTIWEAIHTLKNDVTEFCKNSSYAEQALKALVDYKLPVDEIKGINVEDLRTALFHILMTKRN